MMTKEMVRRLKEEREVIIKPTRDSEIKLHRAESWNKEDVITVEIRGSAIDTRVAYARQHPYTENKEELDELIRACLREYSSRIGDELITLYNKANDHNIADNRRMI